MNYPVISIITPNFNNGRFLESTIQSVLNQNYPNLEYIIIDGGSTDNSLEIIEKYKNSLAYWISEPDQGMYDAIAKGISRSTGDIITWLNSDDLYVLNSLHMVGKIFYENQDLKCITGCPTFIDEIGSILFTTPPINASKITFLAGEYRWIQQESTFFRKELITDSILKDFSSFKYAGDFYLWLMFLLSGVTIHPIQTVFSAFRYRKGQLSGDMEKYLNEVEDVLNVHRRNLDKKTEIRLKKYKTTKKLFNLVPGFRSLNYTTNFLRKLAGQPDPIKL